MVGPGFDVNIVDETAEVAALAVQGLDFRATLRNMGLRSRISNPSVSPPSPQWRRAAGIAHRLYRRIRP